VKPRGVLKLEDLPSREKGNGRVISGRKNDLYLDE
jgi:hypothetical protein